MLLEIKNLAVEVSGKLVLKDINLSIDEGETHVLLGPNGAGKSTLFLTILGFPQYKVVKGSILFKGQDITDLTTDERVKLGIGVIEGPRGTNVHMSKIENGKTQFYSAIVPTTWNIPTMGPATEGFSHELAPHVIRAYDPCLSCATHVMVVNDEDKSVIKNEMVRI